MGMELSHGSGEAAPTAISLTRSAFPHSTARVRGAGYHTLGEYIDLNSLVERGRLIVGLLAVLS